MTLFALALGVSVQAPDLQSSDNPHLMATRRLYQDLIYRDRKVFLTPAAFGEKADDNNRFLNPGPYVNFYTKG